MIEKMTSKKLEGLKGRKPVLHKLVIDPINSDFTDCVDFISMKLCVSIEYARLNEHSIYYTRSNGEGSLIYVFSAGSIYFVGNWVASYYTPAFMGMFNKMTNKKIKALDLFEFLHL